MRVIHALDPSAKIVENVLGKLQNRLERERGYCGRDERRDCPEAVQKAKRLVESGKAHPSEFFYSADEWLERLNAICNAYNDDPQDGKRLNGMAPRAAFVKLLQAPPARLDDSTRYLLSNHRRVEMVRRTGLTIKIGKSAYTYKSEATGRLIGQKVLVWFDMEDPSRVTITTLDGKGPVTVERETVLPAWHASKDKIGQAKRENAAHAAPARQLYSALKKEYPEEMGRRSARPVFADDATRELGAAMQTQKATRKAEQARVDRTRRAVDKEARRAGLQLPQASDLRQLEAQRRLAALMS